MLKEMNQIHWVLTKHSKIQPYPRQEWQPYPQVMMKYNADDISKECEGVEEMNQIHIVF
jgi:hypothetical protein